MFGKFKNFGNRVTESGDVFEWGAINLVVQNRMYLMDL